MSGISRFATPWLLLALVFAGLLGCEKASTPRPSALISQDIDQLAKLIVLPQRPLSAQWSITTRGDGCFGPQDESLTVVLRYPVPVASRLLAACPAAEMAVPFRMEDWFPAELKRLATPDGRTPTLDRHLPAPFLKSPFLNGTVAAIPDSGLLLLHLFTN